MTDTSKPMDPMEAAARMLAEANGCIWDDCARRRATRRCACVNDVQNGGPVYLAALAANLPPHVVEAACANMWPWEEFDEEQKAAERRFMTNALRAALLALPVEQEGR